MGVRLGVGEVVGDVTRDGVASVVVSPSGYEMAERVV